MSLSLKSKINKRKKLSESNVNGKTESNSQKQCGKIQKKKKNSREKPLEKAAKVFHL